MEMIHLTFSIRKVPQPKEPQIKVHTLFFPVIYHLLDKPPHPVTVEFVKVSIAPFIKINNFLTHCEPGWGGEPKKSG